VTTAVELIERIRQAWNTGDVAQMVADCDPDVVLRPDPGLRVIEGIPHGVEACLRFLEAQREAMGLGELTVLEQHDFGSWCASRMRQQIHSASGVDAEWEWTVAITAREGKIVMIEFFVDDALAQSALGL
jgi:ketosteroid isomerase-like protein